MKIVFWNVHKGFRDGARRIDPAKVELAQEFIHSEAPEVFVLNEADYTEPFYEDAFDYEAAFGFGHSHAHQYEGHMGNCILSSLPLHDARVHVAGRRSGLACGIARGGRDMTVSTFHAHPQASGTDKAAAIMATTLLRPGPCVIVGDFNSISPEDGVAFDDLEFRLRPIARDNSSVMARRLLDDGAAICSALAAGGFRDLVPAHARRHTMPARLPDGDHQTQVRIDHAWASLAVVGSASISDDFRLAQVSDHRPLILEVEG